MKLGITLLLVEDNALNRDMLMRRLIRSRFSVLLADNGEVALKVMRESQPDVVLMDMNLPILDGWSACKQAKDDPRIEAIPIIALTAHAMASDRDRALNAGCIGYATKPINFPALVGLIKKHAENKGKPT